MSGTSRYRTGRIYTAAAAGFFRAAFCRPKGAVASPAREPPAVRSPSKLPRLSRIRHEAAPSLVVCLCPRALRTVTVLLDYGIGNLRSLERAFERAGVPVLRSGRAEDARRGRPPHPARRGCVRRVRRALGGARARRDRASSGLGPACRCSACASGCSCCSRARTSSASCARPGPAARPRRPLRRRPPGPGRARPQGAAHGLERARTQPPAPGRRRPRGRAARLLCPLVPRRPGRSGRRRRRRPTTAGPCRRRRARVAWSACSFTPRRAAPSGSRCCAAGSRTPVRAEP